MGEGGGVGGTVGQRAGSDPKHNMQIFQVSEDQSIKKLIDGPDKAGLGLSAGRQEGRPW